ncbi:DUF2846 domain-containing protein [Sphingomonas sp. ac-8]|uniref:DUF2846 domain-containing protein n=1 Tax=Sphingomonas sp. ac-8 TaxID=3242977 RepID=UPI003A8120F3
MRPDNTKWIVLTVVAVVFGALLGPALLGSLPGGIAWPIALVLILAPLGYVVWVLAGNKVGKAATPAAMADAQAFVPAPGMARIYVVRRGFMGGMAGMKVAIEGVASGQIRMNQFVMAEVPPGSYTIETAMARNGMKPSNAETTLTVAAGDLVTLRAMLQVNATHAVTVHERLSLADGRFEIGRAKMVQWTEDRTVFA